MTWVGCNILGSSAISHAAATASGGLAVADIRGQGSATTLVITFDMNSRMAVGQSP